MRHICNLTRCFDVLRSYGSTSQVKNLKNFLPWMWHRINQDLVFIYGRRKCINDFSSQKYHLNSTLILRWWKCKNWVKFWFESALLWKWWHSRTMYVLHAALKHVPSAKMLQIGMVCRSENCIFDTFFRLAPCKLCHIESRQQYVFVVTHWIWSRPTFITEK